MKITNGSSIFPSLFANADHSFAATTTLLLMATNVSQLDPTRSPPAPVFEKATNSEDPLVTD